MATSTPWWQDGIIYQIYPAFFCRQQPGWCWRFGRNHLPPGLPPGIGGGCHLAFSNLPLPMVDFGYDVADYCNIDPLFGSLEDFDTLVEQSHARGIRIIMDLVLNHSSDQHPWFLESRSSRENPYRDWYIWQNARPGRKFPNNWASVFGGRAWEYDAKTEQYYYHMFCPQQPDLKCVIPRFTMPCWISFDFG